MSSCTLCGIDRHVVARNDHWALCLNDDQAFLGRCFVALNRHETDVTSLSQAERDSLWDLLAQGKGALDKLFKPDHYNYAFLMNLTPHVHMHIIPRYAAPRTFGGVDVTDTAFNAHYDPAAALLLPEPVQADLAAAIKGALAR
ncbi:MAG TPA: HIT family protein [Capsulimonadaceae bacterium]|jgi:diadenosine tetraphosphate (Ap4A) HIT family hydrolase